MPPQTLLRDLGDRVRALREARGLSRRQLAARAHLSERFLAQVELGEGNPSIVSLAQIARALDTTAPDLLTPPVQRKPVALLGLRGAGKSTIGAALARKLRVPFEEVDQRVERAAGLSLQEVFVLHGEDYYRRLEREAIEGLIAGETRFVCAVSGGVVTNPPAFEALLRSASTIWLRARPEDHWNRVLEQGDRRPMSDDPRAMETLRELLERRAPLYAKAEHVVDTSRLSVAEAVDSIVRALKP